MQATPYKYTKIDLNWIENREGIEGFDGTLVTLEIIGQKIAQFREEIERIKQLPKSTKVAPFIERFLEDSKLMSPEQKLSKKHYNTKLSKRDPQ